LLKANRGAVRLVEFLTGPIAPGSRINLADALVGPDLLRPHLVNWTDVAGYFIRTVEADAAADGSAETAELLERLLSYADARAAQGARRHPICGPGDGNALSQGGPSLRLFTTIATLGTPQDVMVQEIRIENFFSMDAGTAALLRGWANPAIRSRPRGSSEGSTGVRGGPVNVDLLALASCARLSVDNFRCWRLTGSVAAGPALLRLTLRRPQSAIGRAPILRASKVSTR
jgi:hypothetical protein